MKHTKQLQLFNTQEEQDNSNSKPCINCKKVKPFSAFAKREGGCGKSLRSECSECLSERGAVVSRLLKENPRPADDNYKCPCCKKTEAELKTFGRWADRSVWCLDHDHKRKQFRGWICNNCNNGLGRFYDDIKIIQNVLKYLKNYEKEIKNT